MRHLKRTTIMVAILVLTVFLGAAGCGGDHPNRIHSDQDRYPARYERQDNDRHEERQDSDRHEDRGRDYGREGEHADR